HGLVLEYEAGGKRDQIHHAKCRRHESRSATQLPRTHFSFADAADTEARYQMVQVVIFQEAPACLDVGHRYEQATGIDAHRARPRSDHLAEAAAPVECVQLVL